MQPRRFVTLDAENEPPWVRLYVQPIGAQWVAVFVANGAEPPSPGKLKGMRFFADTRAEAEARALACVGRCTEQSWGMASETALTLVNTWSAGESKTGQNNPNQATARKAISA